MANQIQNEQPFNTLELLTIDNLEDFENGSSSSFTVDDGSYDAVVVGWALVKNEYEGKISNRVQLYFQFADEEGKVHNLRGNAWALSANEKSHFRIDLMGWLNTSEWSRVIEVLKQGKILVPGQDGKGSVNPDGFIGWRAKLLVGTKKSKAGKDFNVIMSISPCKKKNFQLPEFADVPWFYANGDDVISCKLAEGIKVGQPKESKQASAQPAQQPQQQVGQSNAMLANKGAVGAPMNNVNAQAYFNPQAAPVQGGDLAAQLPVADDEDSVQLPF